MSKKDRKDKKLPEKGDYRCLLCGKMADIEHTMPGNKTVQLTCGCVIPGFKRQDLERSKV